MKRLSAFTLIILAGTSAHAMAAANAEGASRLTSVLQAYFGEEPGVVGVTVDGDAYDVRIDFAPHLAKIKDPKVSASITPLELKLTDQGGGKWQVDHDQSMSFAFKVEGALDMKGSFGNIKSSSIFDEALGTYASGTSDITQIAFQQTITEKGQTSDVTYTIASMHTEMSASGGSDGVDGSLKSSFTDLRETINMPPQPGASMPPMQFSVAAPTGSQDLIFAGLKAKPLNELVAWFVARPSPEAIVADQADLKDKLRAAMPLWSKISGTSTLDGLNIKTMLGDFGVEKLDVSVDMNGIVADGKLREAFTFSGFKMPDGIVPPWAAGLVPNRFTIDFNLSDFDLAAPAKLVIDNFDLTQDPPIKPEMEQQLLSALLPKMAVKVGLGPSEIVSSIFDLKAEGSMTAGPVAMPSGSALVKLKGLDEIMSALQSAPPEMGMQQVAPVVLIAKGLAKTDADGYLSWQIESTPQGSVTINGIDPMKMSGGGQ